MEKEIDNYTEEELLNNYETLTGLKQEDMSLEEIRQYLKDYWKEQIYRDSIKKENCIKTFGEIFEIDNIEIDTTKLPLLKYILREFGEDLYTPSEKNEKLKNEKEKLKREFETILTKEQYEKFIKYWELENKSTEELEEQLFMYGFIMAKELDRETKNIKKRITRINLVVLI